MNVIVLYSPGREGEVISLVTLLKMREIPFTAERAEPPGIQEWKPWIDRMRSSTHTVFLPGADTWTSPFWLWAAGYALGAHEKSYLHAMEGCVGPFDDGHFWVCSHFDKLVDFLMDDRDRWERMKEQRVAEAELKQREKEISISGFVFAIKEGSIEDVLLYLKMGFSPDARDRKGVGVLHHAVRNARREIAEILIVRGADIDAVAQDRGNTPLMDAAAEDQVEVLTMLLERGAALETESKNGQTALVLAVGRKSERCARLLVEAGADPNHADSLGMSASSYANVLGFDSLKRLFLEKS